MPSISRLVPRVRDIAHHQLYRRQWNSAVIKSPISVVAGLAGPKAQAEALSSAIWLPEPSGGYVADPFGFQTKQGDYRILVEHFDWRQGIGSIAMCTFDERGFSEYVPVLELSSHLSYPFVICHGDEILFIPEHSAARDVSAFAISAEGKVAARQTLFRDRPLVDSSIVVWEGRYWLFAIENDRQWNAELNVFFADDIFGPWFPHARNPVKIDSASARPAGTPFVHKGQLYRPAQDCSDNYGAAVVINHVTELTPTGFDEVSVGIISSQNLDRYNTGLHTLSEFGDFTLIDASRKSRRYW